jgi:hypothetical protein
LETEAESEAESEAEPEVETEADAGASTFDLAASGANWLLAPVGDDNLASTREAASANVS